MNKNELYHFGILGMRWGVRRFQNKDGSLTAAGQKRYSGKDQDPYESIRKKISAEANEAYLNYDKDKMFQASKEYNQLADELGQDMERYVDSLKTNKKFQNSVYEDMRKEFGNGTYTDEDIDDLFEMVADEHFFNRLNQNYPESFKEKFGKFEDAKNRYFGEAEKATKSLVEKYKDTKISDNEWSSAKNYINNEFLKNDPQSQWNSYMARHFDDYWINDPAYEKMPYIINREGYDEYVKTHK